MFQHILVGHDGSPSCDRAFRLAVALARAFGGRVRLVGVVEPPPIEAPALAIEDEQALVRGALERLVAAAGADAGCPIDLEVACGLPSNVLLGEVRAHAIDHIVLGRTGKGAIGRLLLGSVSSEMVRRAPVGVTLVP